MSLDSLCERLEVGLSTEEIKNITLKKYNVKFNIQDKLRFKFKKTLSKYIKNGWIPMGEPREDFSGQDYNSWSISIWVYAKVS